MYWFPESLRHYVAKTAFKRFLCCPGVQSKLRNKVYCTVCPFGGLLYNICSVGNQFKIRIDYRWFVLIRSSILNQYLQKNKIFLYKGRLHENFLQLVGHYVWRSCGYSSDISGFRQSFYTVWRSRGLSSDIFKIRQTCLTSLTDFGKPVKGWFHAAVYPFLFATIIDDFFGQSAQHSLCIESQSMWISKGHVQPPFLIFFMT